MGRLKVLAAYDPPPKFPYPPRMEKTVFMLQLESTRLLERELTIQFQQDVIETALKVPVSSTAFLILSLKNF